MQYILDQWIITGKFSQWIVILQELNLEFTTPKTNKWIALEKFITDLPIGKYKPPINDTLHDENLFIITIGDPSYGDILTY